MKNFKIKGLILTTSLFVASLSAFSTPIEKSISLKGGDFFYCETASTFSSAKFLLALAGNRVTISTKDINVTGFKDAPKKNEPGRYVKEGEMTFTGSELLKFNFETDKDDDKGKVTIKFNTKISFDENNLICREGKADNRPTYRAGSRPG